MSTSLLDLVRFTHRVLDFMIQQPADRLVEFAEGRYRLTLVPVEQSSATAPVASPAEAAPDADLATPEPRPPVGRPTSTPVPRPIRTGKRTTEASLSSQAAVEIAERLRRCATVDEGLAYLESVAVNNTDRKAVGRALGIAGVAGMRKDDLVKQILQHAIGARRKFAGLSSW